ncbi:hypothetical protein ABPG72_003084 [Tetrahymena utriculariae]
MATKQIITLVGQLQNSQWFNGLNDLIKKSSELKILNIEISQTSSKGELYNNKNFIELSIIEQASQISSLQDLLKTTQSLTDLKFEGTGQFTNDFISKLGECIGDIDKIERLEIIFKDEQENTKILPFINLALKNKSNLRYLEIAYIVKNNFDHREQEREFAQFNEIIQNSQSLYEFKIKINDESIPQQAFQSLIDIIVCHQSIKKIEISLKEELNVFFIDYITKKPQNVQLTIINHNLTKQGLIIQPNQVSNQYLQNLTGQFNRNQFVQTLESLKINFPKSSIIDDKYEYLDLFSESIQKFEKLKNIDLKIQENFCKNLTWVANIFNNLSSINCLEELFLSIKSNNTFNQLELNEFLFKLQSFQALKKLNIFIKNQKQEIFCFFTLRSLPILKSLDIENEEILISYDKNDQKTTLKLKQDNICQNSNIEQFVNQNKDLKNIQIESTNQNFLSIIYLSAITNNQIKYQKYVSQLSISKALSFLFYNLDITLTNEISENGVKALCYGIVNNIPKLENFKIAFQRDLQNNEVQYLSHILQEKKEISTLDLQFQIKNQHSIQQLSELMIPAISQNQVLKNFKLKIDGASSFHFLTLISKCKNLLKIFLNKNEITFEKQVNHKSTSKVISLELVLFQLISLEEANLIANQIQQLEDLVKLKICANNFDEQETIFIKSITQLQHLKDLEIKSQDQQTDDFIFYSLLSQHPFLTKEQLKIKSNYQLSYQKQDQILEINIHTPIENINQKQKLESLIQYFQNLKILNIKINSYNNARDLLDSFSNSLIHLKNLNTLEIKTENKIDQQTISTLLSKMAHLSNLKYFQLTYFNNEGIDTRNIEELNRVVKSLIQIQKFNLQLTTNSQVFDFRLFSTNNENDPKQQNEKEKQFLCEISINNRENQKQDFYHIFENKKDQNIFKDINITCLNINFSQKSNKCKIFDSVFSQNCFENLVFLQNLSISINEYSINEEQLTILTRNISSLQNIQKLSLDIKKLIGFSKQNIIEIGKSIKKSKNSIRFIGLTIENKIEYQDIKKLIKNIQDASQLEELSLNLNLQSTHSQDKKKYFSNKNLKKLRSFDVKIEGQCQNMCQLIYQIISDLTQLSYLKISIGQNSGILQEDINYISKVFLTSPNIEKLILQIQQQEQSKDIFICNLQEQSHLKYLEIAIDQSNTSQKTIRCLTQELKNLKNIQEFKCFIDHPYSLIFLEQINTIQNVEIKQLCKFKYQQFEIIDEAQEQILKFECLEDTLKKCSKKQLKCAIQNCLPHFKNFKYQQNNSYIKELFVELIPQKDRFTQYRIDGLTHAIQQLESLQHIQIVFPHNLAINKHNGQYLKEMLKKLTYLMEVKLSTQQIDKDGCEQIGQGLEYLQFLLSLDIQIGENNQIEDEGIKNLLQLFNNFSQLRSLSLVIGQNNQINEIGVKHICNALIKQKQLLTELVLGIKQDNNIGEGVKHLKDSLCQMQELQQLTLFLDINNNGIKNQYPILDSIKELSQLKALSINIIGLDKQKRKEFIYYIKSFQILAYFEFQTKIYYKEIQESALLLQSIQNNTSLTIIKYPFINLQYHILPIKLIEVDCRLQK